MILINMLISTFFCIFLIAPRGWISGLFAAIIIISLWYSFKNYKKTFEFDVSNKLGSYYVVFLLLAVVSVLSSGNIKLSYLENYYRLLFFISLVYLFYSKVNIQQIPKYINLGIFISLIGVIIHWHLKISRPISITGNMNVVQFGDIILFLSVLSLSLTYYYKGRFTFVNFIIVLLAIVAALLNESRGGLLIIPYVVLVFSVFYPRNIKKMLLFILLSILALSVVYTCTHILDSSVARIMGSYTEMETRTDGSSMGMRVEMWCASWRMFIDHPIFGVGLSNWQNALDGQIQLGVAHSYLEFNQPHSEYLFYLSTMGIIGFIAFIVFLLLPLYLLRKYSKNLQLLVWIITGSYMIGALTQAVFTHRDSFMLYIISMSLVFALARKEHILRKVSSIS